MSRCSRPRLPRVVTSSILAQNDGINDFVQLAILEHTKDIFTCKAPCECLGDAIRLNKSSVTQAEVYLFALNETYSALFDGLRHKSKRNAEGSPSVS